MPRSDVVVVAVAERSCCHPSEASWRWPTKRWEVPTGRDVVVVVVVGYLRSHRDVERGVARTGVAVASLRYSTPKAGVEVRVENDPRAGAADDGGWGPLDAEVAYPEADDEAAGVAYPGGEWQIGVPRGVPRLLRNVGDEKIPGAVDDDTAPSGVAGERDPRRCRPLSRWAVVDVVVWDF